jgi:ubiquinone/menaquinone biosynthesis C-methylase UbiE
MQIDNLKPGAPTHETEAAREIAHFDAMIAQYGEFNPFHDRGWRELGKLFERYVEPDREARLLDVGCGTGSSYSIYRERVKRYIGIDLSFESVRVGRAHHPDLSFIRGDACVLPFADASFDIVAFSSLLHHIDDYVLPLHEAMRVLRPGGFAFAFDPNLLHPPMAILRHPKSPFYSPVGVSPNERPLMPGALRRAFRQAQFVNLKQRCFADLPYRLISLKFPSLLLRTYNAGAWLVEQIGLGRWFGSFTVTVGQKPMRT